MLAGTHFLNLAFGAGVNRHPPNIGGRDYRPFWCDRFGLRGYLVDCSKAGP